LLIAENHEDDFPSLQVLLVTDVLVSGQQDLEARCLRNRYQFAVKKPVPSALEGFDHYMAFERMPEGGWNAVVK
jgi:hypothetical protein